MTNLNMDPREKEQGLRRLLASIGAIPLVVVASVLFFGALEPNFLSGDNMYNLMRQSSYLVLICIAQFLILLTGGIDLSVGSTVSLASVVSAIVMKTLFIAMPDQPALAVAAGAASGVLIGAAIGLLNGFGVAFLNVTPFVMTLGTLSMALGLALFASGGYSISGLPSAFGDVFAYGSLFGLPAPVLYAVLVIVVVQILLTWTTTGRYIYAIGSNANAARLSGIRTRRQLMLTYVIAGMITGFAAVLMTARTESGEANLGGADMILRSVAGCIIGGVALTGGKGLLRNVVLGAFFITLLMNGMNLLRVNSYLQTFIMGLVLILAIALDQWRARRSGQRTV
jgi:ribose/xylose/arabinose/galactoside ABC-type transport system permease subunit